MIRGAMLVEDTVVSTPTLAVSYMVSDHHQKLCLRSHLKD